MKFVFSQTLSPCVGHDDFVNKIYDLLIGNRNENRKVNHSFSENKEFKS